MSTDLLAKAIAILLTGLETVAMLEWDGDGFGRVRKGEICGLLLVVVSQLLCLDWATGRTTKGVRSGSCWEGELTAKTGGLKGLNRGIG
jgi:hypothetical protein